MSISRVLATCALMMTSVHAFAAPNTVYGTDFGTGSEYTAAIADTNVTFYAKTKGNRGLKDGVFSYKPAQDGYQGVGVSPLKGSDVTVGEIDKNEWIIAKFDDATVISNLTLGLLFNGPEYGDNKEQASITVTYFDNSTDTFKLVATGDTTAFWSGLGSVTNLSPAIDGLGGVWSLDNPFGDTAIKSFSLTSLKEKSDFTLYSVTAVPEPESYAMLALGLGLVGFMARRGRSRMYA
ncbi:PEP-CTERM sorting domain-containing protein [Methylobacillus flagellatus]|uniref:PEP-CTERM sorting domain-containing protein n=1 Tax=Methylobacillus flagellatus TaxID=405 RepID=UPI0028540DA2|nr:PEP-CTERM sorting domain-containing protein [Methylobacillus flagellatus]MDR5171143.1 PEP-CTERM sorting domain-containing protein [Methylobacillus flagellatus]